MAPVPTYEELISRIKELEAESAEYRRAYENIKTRDKKVTAEHTFPEDIDYFRSIVENSHDGIILIDDSYHIIYANEEFRRILDYPPEELLGRDFRIFLAEETRETVINHYRMRQRGETPPQRYEFMVVRRGGTKRWVETSSSIIKDPQGRIKSMAQLLDITDRKKAEDDLRKSEELHSKLISALPDIVVRLDLDGNIIFINDIALQISGYERAEIEQMNMLSFIAPEDHEKAINNTMLMFDKVLGPQEYHLVMKDGRKLLFEVNGDVLRDHEGAPYGMVHVCRDITERKRTEEALAESESKYRLLADNINDNIWILELENLRFSYLSPSILHIIGYSAEEVINFDLQDFVTPSSLEMALIVLKEELALEKKGADPNRLRTFEVEQYKKQGGTIWTEVSVQFIRDPDGRPVSILGVTRDISERKALQNQLQQSQKMEAIGTLASGIAHDFNNILQAVGGNVQLILKKADLDRGIHKYVAEIDGAVNRAAELIQNLLTSSRKVEPRMKALDVENELKQALGILNRTIPKMIRVETGIAPGTRLIHADPNQLGQVFMNLGTNARDAMPEGGCLVFEAVNTVLDDEFCRRNIGARPGEYVRISVSDTGHGMDENTLKQVFNPFFTTKDIGKGTGLGMAVVYGIVKNHGGYITCNSSPGRGTVFTIYWPAAQTGETAPPRDEPLEDDVQCGDETIMVVDDEESIVEVAREVLTGCGYKVIYAASGEEALEIYEAQGRAIDLVLLDLGMPGIGGHKALVELLKSDPAAKILIVSGYSSTNQIKSTLEAGAAGFVGKPYKLNELLQKVREILDR